MPFSRIITTVCCLSSKARTTAQLALYRVLCIRGMIYTSAKEEANTGKLQRMNPSMIALPVCLIWFYNVIQSPVMRFVDWAIYFYQNGMKREQRTKRHYESYSPVASIYNCLSCIRHDLKSTTERSKMLYNAFCASIRGIVPLMHEKPVQAKYGNHGRVEPPWAAPGKGR